MASAGPREPRGRTRHRRVSSRWRTADGSSEPWGSKAEAIHEIYWRTDSHLPALLAFVGPRTAQHRSCPVSHPLRSRWQTMFASTGARLADLGSYRADGRGLDARRVYLVITLAPAQIRIAAAGQVIEHKWVPVPQIECSNGWLGSFPVGHGLGFGRPGRRASPGESEQGLERSFDRQTDQWPDQLIVPLAEAYWKLCSSA